MKTGDLSGISRTFEFGPFRMDPTGRSLERDGEPVIVSPKAFDTLLALVENHGHAVKKDELIRAVWPDTFVEENNLNQYISVLRKALGENGDGQRYIETIPRWGYRFVGEVRETWGEHDEVTVSRRSRTSVVVREDESDDTPAARPRRIALGALVVGLTVVVAAIAFYARFVGSSPQAVAAPDIRSMAVLPFKNLDTRTDEDASLALGMADAVINRLSRLDRVRVLSTSAIQKYPNAEDDPIAAGRALNVDAILEGRIQKADGRIRVTVQLVSTRDGVSLWTEWFDEDLGNVFALQDAIAARVARGLAPVLDGGGFHPPDQPTASPKAYEAYLRGRYLWSKRSTESVRASIACFQEAIDADPNFALAYVGLADAYSIQAAPLAEPALSKALELDDRIGEAHASVGFYRMFHHWDMPMADRELRLAISLSPNYATAHQWYALSLAVRGRLDEAKVEMASAIACDPLSPNMHADMGQICYFAGDDDAAIAHCRKALELDPNFSFAHGCLFAVFARKGRYDEAVDEYLTCVELGKNSLEIATTLRAAYAASGWKGFCRARLARRVETRTGMAILYTQLGERKRAMEQIRIAYDEHDFFLIFAAVEPELAPLRSDPQFIEIVRRIGVAAA